MGRGTSQNAREGWLIYCSASQVNASTVSVSSRLAIPAAAPLLETLKSLLSDSPTPLTRAELPARWPGQPANEHSLSRTLSRGCDTGLFDRSGAGTKTDPCRYQPRLPTEAAPAGSSGPPLPPGDASGTHGAAESP